MAAKVPAVASTSQVAEKRKGEFACSFYLLIYYFFVSSFLKDFSVTPTTFTLTSHQPKVSHMTIPCCKGGREIQSFGGIFERMVIKMPSMVSATSLL